MSGPRYRLSPIVEFGVDVHGAWFGGFDVRAGTGARSHYDCQLALGVTAFVQLALEKFNRD